MGQRADTVTRREDIYRDAVAVIVRDFAEDLQVDTVAHAIGTSSRQLQRVMTQVGGASFRSLLTRVRMGNARRLLLETELPVSTIANRVGYSQPAQFAKTFRRHYGDAPASYRTKPRHSAAAPIAPDAGARVATVHEPFAAAAVPFR